MVVKKIWFGMAIKAINEHFVDMDECGSDLCVHLCPAPAPAEKHEGEIFFLKATRRTCCYVSES